MTEATKLGFDFLHSDTTLMYSSENLQVYIFNSPKNNFLENLRMLPDSQRVYGRFEVLLLAELALLGELEESLEKRGSGLRANCRGVRGHANRADRFDRIIS